MGAIIYLLVWSPIAYAIRGAVISLLWRWFVVPLGAPPIGVAWAVGLGIIVSYLTVKAPDKRDDNPELLYAMSCSVGFALIALIVGAIAHYFMH